ncbi:response regulator [Pseudaquidulcibacter saccharophilus]|uniref:response regulator n=1 Tax=Pseudaquidulcibacter saccharophilus TaxID=2831900 RepID=UPI001EFEFF81
MKQFVTITQVTNGIININSLVLLVNFQHMWGAMEQSKGKIIILDDDAEMRNLLTRYLSENNYYARAVNDAQNLYRMLSRENFDLLILDLMIPVEDGLSVCRKLRSDNNNIPIIMATAKGDPIDKILGLEMGADDYIAKPFLPRELLARIEAIRRRSNNSAPLSGKVTFGNFNLDLGLMTLKKDGKPIELSTREFNLLKAFVCNAGRPLSRSQIIDLAFGRDAEVTDRAVDVQILRLRKLIENDPSEPYWLKTMWGHGYIFTKEGE